MKATSTVFGMKLLRLVAVVLGLLVVIAGEAWAARQFCCGGSSVTNPGAFASEQVAAGLRLAGR